MNPVAREKAKHLLFNAVAVVLKDIENPSDSLLIPDDMCYEDYRDLGFLVKKSEKAEQFNSDLYYVGLRVGPAKSYPYDAFELLRVDGTLYIRANGRTIVLLVYKGKGAQMVSNEFILNAVERAIFENTELLAAIDALDKGKKRESRKASK